MFLFKMFLSKVFSLKVFQREPLLSVSPKKYYKLFFNTKNDFSDFEKCFLNFVKYQNTF